VAGQPPTTLAQLSASACRVLRASKQTRGALQTY
jgi:hypothetical protein